MKKLIQTLVLSSTLIGTFAAYAGDGYQREGKAYHHGKGHHAGERFHHGEGKGRGQSLQHLAKKLELTEEQKSAIADIYREYGGRDGRSHKGRFARGVEQLDPASPDYQVQVATIAKEQAEKVEQAIVRRGEIQAKVHEVLTPEQRVKLQELKSERGKKFKRAE